MTKYRHFLAFSCLFFYLSCTFQPLILESLHFLTHLGETGQHNYTDHNKKHDENHSHDFLDLLEISFSTSSDHPSGTEENTAFNLKKLPESGYDVLWLTHTDQWFSRAFSAKHKIYLSPDHPILLPPPKGPLFS